MYNIWNRGTLHLVLLLALLLPAGMTTRAAAPTHPAQFDGGTVTEIPQTECEALVALYNATDGDNWTTKTDWLQTTAPCTWYGVTCEAEHVTHIELSYNNLSNVLPPEIGNLTALTSLFLDHNQLTSLPAEIGNRNRSPPPKKNNNGLSQGMLREAKIAEKVAVALDTTLGLFLL